MPSRPWKGNSERHLRTPKNEHDQSSSLWLAHERAPRLARNFQQFWKLQLPFEHNLSRTGYEAWILRSFRLSWVLITTTPFVAILLLSFVLDWIVHYTALYPFLQAIAMFLHVVLPRRRSWTLMTSLAVLFTQRMLWAFTFGLPIWRPKNELSRGRTGADQEEQLPFLGFVGWLYGWLSDYVDDWNKASPSHYSRRRGMRCYLSAKQIEIDSIDKEELRMIGAFVGQHSQVHTVPVSCTWSWYNDKEKHFDHETFQEGPRHKEKVILYLVGGGFISGVGLKFPLAKPLLRCINAELDSTRRVPVDTSNRRTSRADTVPLLSVEYRKSLSSDTGFPAALQDVIAAWQYLTIKCNYGPENIILCGDSTGANLCIVLSLWLAHRDMKTAGCMILLSPWVDLTLSHPSISKNAYFDILSAEMLQTASDMYVHRRKTSSEGRKRRKSDESSSRLTTRPSGGDANRSIKTYGLAAHPLVSPALRSDSHQEAFRLLGACALDHYQAHRKMRIFITWGTAELFDGEIRTLLDNLKIACKSSEGAIDMVVHPQPDMIHCYGMCLPPLLSSGASTMYKKIRAVVRLPSPVIHAMISLGYDTSRSRASPNWVFESRMSRTQPATLKLQHLRLMSQRSNATAPH